MGRAIWDYFYQENPEDLQTETSISELDDLPVSYLLEITKEMNALEQKHWIYHWEGSRCRCWCRFS